MTGRYFQKQLSFVLNHIAIIAYLCITAFYGNPIENSSCVHLCLISLLFCDAAYISYKNIKNNSILNHFSCLLLLLAWHFLMYLLGQHPLSKAISIILLPICLYQTINFIQIFIFQASSYRWQRQFLLLLKVTCFMSVFAFVISQRFFFTMYQIQFILSLIAVLIIGFIHRKRICFVLKSQRKEFIYSFCFVVLPFACYVAAYYNQDDYMANMGSYFAVMLASVSIHSILVQYHPQQEWYFTLKRWSMLFLAGIGTIGLLITAYLFSIPLTAVFVIIHIAILLAVLFNLLLYVQIHRQPEDFHDPTDRQNFYAYSLSQLKREESLRKDFSNYLHDDILQDLLSIKNLMLKSEQPNIRKLILDTLDGLNTSIRSQMQVYHPTLLKSLTLKENIQNLLDSILDSAIDTSCRLRLDCDDNIFLVEPYTVIIYRMIKELVTNALKHADANEIRVMLIQEKELITLQVTDNGKGFKLSDHTADNHSGLCSIREQVGLLGGKMIIQNAPEHGSQILITMTMKGDDSYESFTGR